VYFAHPNLEELRRRQVKNFVILMGSDSLPSPDDRKLICHGATSGPWEKEGAARPVCNRFTSAVQVI
jgi:hypothetical protein